MLETHNFLTFFNAIKIFNTNISEDTISEQLG